MKTLNQHISIFRTFANNHLQIHSFGVGDLPEFNSSGVVYPFMGVIPTDTSISEGTLTDTYDIVFADLVRHDEINEEYVISAMKQVGLDLMAYLEKSAALGTLSDIIKSATMVPFVERFDDSTAGWVLSLSFEQAMQYDYCNVPILSRPSSGSVCPDVTIYNADGTVNTVVVAGGSYTLSGSGSYAVTINNEAWATISADENIPVVDSSSGAVGTKLGSYWTIADTVYTDAFGAVTNYTAETAINATRLNAMTCAQLNNATTGLTFAQRNLIQVVNTLKTGQTTSARTGDDGDFEYGRGAGFGTLSCNNPFGNTNRFTDETGAQTYTNSLLVDWLTGLMWYTPTQGPDTWGNSIDACLASTQAGYTDWFMPNANQMFAIMPFAGDYASPPLNYTPFSQSGSLRYWTSTTASGSNRITLLNSLNNSALMSGTSAAGSAYYFLCRFFTLAELGL